MDDLISRQAAVEAIEDVDWYHINKDGQLTHGANSKEDEPLYKAEDVYKVLNDVPSAQPERLTDDDFETIRIHLNAQKEKLCNQHRWEEANEYQRILDRFMAFASAQPEPPEWAQKVDEYRKSAPSFVRNQLVWALYQTWKEYDGRLVHQRGKENR